MRRAAPAARSAPALALVFALALAAGADAARVSGVVRTIQRPLGGVQVVEPRSGAYASTDSAGRFEIALEPGVHELHLAAVGYAAFIATITVPAGDTYDSGPWLLSPLRPDGGVGMVATVPPPTSSDTSKAGGVDGVPLPAPIAPSVTFAWSDAERERWLAPKPTDAFAPGAPEAAAREILLSIATSDSITASTGGTGAPGPEAWRQWGDKLTVLGLEHPLAADTVFLRRAVAYARTRGALATGPTYTGYQSAKTARAALALAERSAPGDDAFLGRLQGALDATFVPGYEPPKPKPAPAPKKRRAKKR